MSRRLLLLPAAVLLSLLTSCAPVNRLLKARPAGLSAFFEQPELALDARKHGPFQTVWTTPDAALLARGAAARKLYIAPVTLRYLRPVGKAMSRQEIEWGVQRQAAQVAWQLREEFAAAFQRSPAARYQIVRRPAADAAVLELAITELNPTSPKGNAVVTLAKVLNPVAALGRFFTKGDMAIEGKVLAPGGRRAFFQFADHEADRLTFVNARDYTPYGHAMQSMRDWAVQFEEFTRSPSGLRVKDSAAVTLKLN
ncbi:MAG: DUF3313 family protein [Verrucomicrobiaceae bacterium]|jgi:hypothetical protein|nr:DUF3313 family protein [Verrucomicrobiaceae bacterium]